MKKYSKQFKQKCVLDVKRENGNIKSVAKRMNINEKELENWVKTKSVPDIVQGSKAIEDRTEFKANLFKKYKMDIGIKGATKSICIRRKMTHYKLAFFRKMCLRKKACR